MFTDGLEKTSSSSSVTRRRLSEIVDPRIKGDGPGALQYRGKVRKYHAKKTDLFVVNGPDVTLGPHAHNGLLASRPKNPVVLEILLDAMRKIRKRRLKVGAFSSQY